MILYRATHYRIYPNAEQASRLSRWQGALRCLWNLAHEQRLAGLSGHRVYAVRRCVNTKCKRAKAAAETVGPIIPADDGETCVECGQAIPYPKTAKGAVDERRFVHYLDQQADLTELRAEVPWMADVPCASAQGILRDLDKAWSRAFKGLNRAPRWKRRSDPQPGLFASAPRVGAETDSVVFPKVGSVAAVIHRAAPGAVKSIRLQRDVDQWFAVVSSEVEVADPAPHPGPPVGIDRGVVNLAADSDGRVIVNSFGRSGGQKRSRHSGGGEACGGSGVSRPVRQEESTARSMPSHSAPGVAPCAGEEAITVSGTIISTGTVTCAGEEARRDAARMAKAQRDVARKVEQAKADGRRPDGANIRKARERVAKLHRKTRRQREHALHDTSKRYAETYSIIAIEHLNVKAMTASAKGTAEEPGKNVAAKSGLNREILSAGWSKFAWMLRYKVEERGGKVVEVPAAYSSQTCHGCGHVAAENRTSQATFECVACGLVEHADVNAAKVILQRALAGDVVPPKAPRKSLGVLRRAKGTKMPKKTDAPPVEEDEAAHAPPVVEQETSQVREDPLPAAVPAVEACGGEAPATAPGEAGTQRREAQDPVAQVRHIAPAYHGNQQCFPWV